MARYFGTDGIRGRAGEGKLSAESLSRLAEAIGTHFGAGATVVIGRDTRESGPEILGTLKGGFLRQGVNVLSVGVLPTPATAMMVPHLGADFGLMITASHNPWHDNGLKLFGPDGRKISDAAQDSIETLIETAMSEGLPASEVAGTEKGEMDDATTYVDSVVEAFRSTGIETLMGLRVAADCANGAAYQTLPAILERLGAHVTLIGASPDGRNINKDVGSTHPEALSACVRETNADIGIALDGDADRLILVNHNGEVVDGDQIIARLATDWQAMDQLKSGSVVSTVMSNLGLELYLSERGIGLERTPVGDRHVAARMSEIGANLGGEPSGHLLMTDHALTGDGSLAAVMILAGLLQSGQSSSDYLDVFAPFPQVLRNVRYNGVSPLTHESVQAAITQADDGLGESGRVLVRASGTEPLIRVMAEGKDTDIVSSTVDELCRIIETAAR